MCDNRIGRKNCPWWEDVYKKTVSQVSEEPEYKDWHFYELPFSAEDHKKICGNIIKVCPVTFIKNKDGQNTRYNEYLEEDQLKEALKA